MGTIGQPKVSYGNFVRLYGENETDKSCVEWCNLPREERIVAINNIAKFLASRSKLDPKITAEQYLKQKRYMDFEKTDL